MGLLERTLKEIFPQSTKARELAKERLDNLAIPHWALGDLMDLAIDIAGMTDSIQPVIRKKAIVIMAGDHGVTAEGVSRYPKEVTLQMVHNFVNGRAGINALSRQSGTEVFVVDMGVDADLKELAESGRIINKKVGLGTDNIAKGPAMSKAMAIRAIESGIDIAAELVRDFDVLGTGDMGIGNTTPSAAIAAACTGKPVAELTGRGTGLNDEQLAAKIVTIQKALEVNKPNPRDGIDILAKVGGFEIGGLAGLIIGGAAKRKILVIDGFISTRALCEGLSCFFSPLC